MTWWIPLATTAASAYLGYQQQKEQAKARKDQALINMYSPLFNQSPQALGMEQNFMAPAAIGGAIQGYGLMRQIDADAAKEKEAKEKAAMAAAEEDTEVFMPYSIEQPIMSKGVPENGPYSYRPFNPFQAKNPYSGG